MKIVLSQDAPPEKFVPFSVTLYFNSQADVDSYAEALRDVVQYDKVPENIGYMKPINKLTQLIKFRQYQSGSWLYYINTRRQSYGTIPLGSKTSITESNLLAINYQR